MSARRSPAWQESVWSGRCLIRSSSLMLRQNGAGALRGGALGAGKSPQWLRLLRVPCSRGAWPTSARYGLLSAMHPPLPLMVPSAMTPACALHHSCMVRAMGQAPTLQHTRARKLHPPMWRVVGAEGGGAFGQGPRTQWRPCCRRGLRPALVPHCCLSSHAMRARCRAPATPV